MFLGTQISYLCSLCKCLQTLWENIEFYNWACNWVFKLQWTLTIHGIYITLSANRQVVVVAMDTLCCIQYHITKCQHGFSSICWHMTYVNTFYNLFTTSLMNIIFNYFTHPFDDWILFLCFITYLQLAWWICSFIIHSSIWQVDSKYPYFLQLIYNYLITSLMNIFLNYFIHPFEKWILFLSFATNLQLKMKWK
jgi:hypothetical protein